MPSRTYDTLKTFIREKMRMSHIYQPVMLAELLKGAGSASIKQIAKALLARDESQVAYYEEIVKNMVGKVLTKNHGLTERTGDRYQLKDFVDLSPSEVNSLTDLCGQKIDEYVERRGKRIWEHRTSAPGYLSGTLKYEVLKRAKFHCELCGVSADERALEADHIIPRNKGGTDDISNLQSLCYSCNASKRDRDNTDFREIVASYSARKKGCLFCEIKASRIIAENNLCYAIRDGFPVTNLHTLFIPKRHISDYFDLYQPEHNAIRQLVSDVKQDILDSDETVVAFNMGVNAGKEAGQTIAHAHVHLIPRRVGDVPDPRGGVRGVIPAQQSY
jgi:diadenosine tetraphosphate (Ap4A) HIT family hydrolase/5-methylcytosine-specific restriction endonuclease McrA